MTTQTIIFIVGLGTPANLYDDLVADLKQRLPHTKILVVEWWSQHDFGMSALQSHMVDSEVVLISFSGGGVIALQALEKWPQSIKKIVLLDSHFLRKKALPTVEQMLDIMLANDDIKTQTKIRDAYAPLLKDDAAFKKSFTHAIDWVDTKFDAACQLLKKMPAHSVLFIGFTNSSYQVLNNEEINALTDLWHNYNVDVHFYLINHFGLVENKNINLINQKIADWLLY